MLWQSVQSGPTNISMHGATLPEFLKIVRAAMCVLLLLEQDITLFIQNENTT